MMTGPNRNQRLRALARVAVVMAIAGVVGAYGGGRVFELFEPIPASDEGGIRVALAVATCSFVAFVWSVKRILGGEEPTDMRVASDLNASVVAGVLAAIGYLIGTTVFR